MLYPYPGAANASAYEHLNRCTDPDELLEKLMWGLAPIDEKVVLDIGAGSGFHAVRYAERASRVYAVEPDHRMLRQLTVRLNNSRLDNITGVTASAHAIPFRDASIDVVYARFAYFFGTEDCLPGLHEVKRVLKVGGHFLIIDADPDRGTYGQIARRMYPGTFHERYRQDHDQFYEAQGFVTYRVDTVFRAPSRRVLEKVFRMEYGDRNTEVIAGIEATELSYGMTVYHLQE